MARAPFQCIGTQLSDGRADVRPRGDPCGFVKVLEDQTLLIPGLDDTLRVKGSARISTDPDLSGGQ